MSSKHDWSNPSEGVEVQLDILLNPGTFCGEIFLFCFLKNHNSIFHCLFLSKILDNVTLLYAHTIGWQIEAGTCASWTVQTGQKLWKVQLLDQYYCFFSGPSIEMAPWTQVLSKGLGVCSRKQEALVINTPVPATAMAEETGSWVPAASTCGYDTQICRSLPACWAGNVFN